MYQVLSVKLISNFNKIMWNDRQLLHSGNQDTTRMSAGYTNVPMYQCTNVPIPIPIPIPLRLHHFGKTSTFHPHLLATPPLIGSDKTAIEDHIKYICEMDSDSFHRDYESLASILSYTTVFLTRSRSMRSFDWLCSFNFGAQQCRF